MVFLEEFFEENEVDEIWLIHPDPQPRDKEERKRLTNSRYLALFKKILKNNSDFYFKTDNYPLFEYSLETIPAAVFEILRQTTDLYNSDLNQEHFGIETHYERLFVSKGYKINYLASKLRK